MQGSTPPRPAMSKRKASKCRICSCPESNHTPGSDQFSQLRYCAACGLDPDTQRYRCEHYIPKRSVSKKKGDRNEDDAYLTPNVVAFPIVERLRRELMPFGPMSWGGRDEKLAILEPSAGTGAFVMAAARVFPGATIHANELNRDRAGALSRAGAHAVSIGPFEQCEIGLYDIILGNPPFALAQEHITRALGMLRHGGVLAFLLKIGFLGSSKRADFWRKHPARYLIPITPRPSFTGGGSDANEYGVFVWQPNYNMFFGAPPFEILEPIEWKIGMQYDY